MEESIMPRPSPRTLGTTIDPETGEKIIFTKFGTQQLRYDKTSPTGVRQIDTGGTFKGITTAPVRAFKETFGFSPFGTPTLNPNVTIAKASSYVPPTSFPTKTNGNGEKDCGWFGEKCWDEETENGTENGCDIGCVLTGRGCDCGCNSLKPCTKCDSDVCEECDGWDLQCEDCMKKAGTCTPPPEQKTALFWAKIIAVVIGIGVFLYLLRPLFSRGKPTGGFTITPA
tara:strand:+ start:26 stop:706 length:681 start_codon:yes stop_codon:yes gene_type:complete